MAIVIVQGAFRVDPDDRVAFLAQSAANMQTARDEQGCLEYVMAADPLDPGRVVLSERWASTEDLNEHLRASAMRRQEGGSGGNAATVTPLEADIWTYEVASFQKLA